MSDKPFKNRYWVNADIKNTEAAFREVLWSYVTGETVTAATKRTGLSRPSVTNAYAIIGGRFAWWNRGRLLRHYAEIFSTESKLAWQPSGPLESEFMCAWYRFWVNQVECGDCLNGRCDVCRKVHRLPMFQFLRKAYRHRRGQGRLQLMRLICLAFARQQAMHYIRSLSPDIVGFYSGDHAIECSHAERNGVQFVSELVSIHVWGVMLSWFRQWPNNSERAVLFRPDVFGSWSSYEEEICDVFSLVGDSDAVNKRVEHHLNSVKRWKKRRINQYTGAIHDDFVGLFEEMISNDDGQNLSLSIAAFENTSSKK